MSEITIIPAILENSKEGLLEKINLIKESGDFQAGWVQIDIADGEFVSNKTIKLNEIVNLEDFLVEVHLMVKKPLNYLEDIKNIGAKRVIIHFESDNLNEALAKAKVMGLEVGIALNPETGVKLLEEYITSIEVLQIMAIHPGKQGNQFLPTTLEKITQASHLKGKNDKLIISVDGGLSAENAKSVVLAGADNLVIGSHLVYGDISQNLEKIWEAIYR